MELTLDLLADGFALADVVDVDLQAWIDTKRACYQKYVDEYYGGWVEDVQIRMNTDLFERARRLSFFRKIVLNGETVGFLGYDEGIDSISGITIHMYANARGHGLGSCFLAHVTSLGKPATLKVFKNNPARNLYERFGFRVYDETPSHYLMRCTPA